MRNKGRAVAISLSMTVCVVAVMLAVGGTAYSNTDILGSFNTEYTTAGTALDDCTTCHTSGSSFNLYGSAIDTAGGRGTDAGLAAIQAVEGDDSDGDTFTNIVEINALTFPGDDTSFPAAVDNTAPTVDSTVPADNAVNVAINVWVMATFSEALDNATVDNNSFLLTDALDNVVAGTVDVTDNTVTFKPDVFLDNTSTYTATLTTA
ncbi:MAG: Ig-like domain-containing protein, partial [Deltaproteobacteria bacterium]